MFPALSISMVSAIITPTLYGKEFIMNISLKKNLAVVCGTLLVVGMLTTGAAALVFAEKSEPQLEPNEPLVSFTCPTVAEIVDESDYDIDAIYNAGLETIAYFAENSSSCAYWADSEVIDFKLLHSFDTGRVAYALFEILGSDGQHGYMISNLEDNFPQQYGDGTSPFAKFEQAVKADEITQLSSELLSAEYYYFYEGMSYGYGVIGDDGLMDIYNIAYYLADVCCGSEVLSDVSFRNTTQTDVRRIRQVMGDEDVKVYAEARREAAEEIAKDKMNADSNIVGNDDID